MTAAAPCAPNRPVMYWGLWCRPVTQIVTDTATGAAALSAMMAARPGEYRRGAR